MYELRAAIAEICRPTEPKISATVDRLEGADRQLLALRSYLRWGDDLASRWSCIGFVSQRPDHVRAAGEKQPDLNSPTRPRP